MGERSMPRIAIAMQLGNYQEAIFLINEALQSMPTVIPYYSVPLLLDRAECFWQLHQYREFLNAFNDYILRSERNVSQRKEYFGRWFNQSELLLDYNLADKFFEFYLDILPFDYREHARCLILFGVHKFLSSDRKGGLSFISHGKHMSWNVFEEHLSRWKRTGIAAVENHNYLRAKNLLKRSMILSMESKNVEIRRAILIHLVIAHFNLNEYDKALEAGQQLFVEGGYSVDEAMRWKERGKKLFREKNYQVLIEVYTLAINFTPEVDGSDPGHSELLAMLLSNRSTAFCKLEAFDKAFEDADLCVKVNPTWSKGHYRLGSSLVGLHKYKKGCQAFCQAFSLADENFDKKDILLKIISAALRLPSGLEDVPLAAVPKALVQDLLKRFVDSKDWQKLRFLFLGGGGVARHKYGQGGLATGCDASGVPLELIVESTIHNPILPKLVDELIKNGAPFMGSPGCAETPLNIAVKKKNKKVVDVLSRYDKSQAIACFQRGVNAFYEEDYENCITYLRTLAIEGILNSDQQLSAYQLLSDAYFATQDYRNGIEYGWKAYNCDKADKVVDLVQSYLVSESWKNRGNDLLPLKLYDQMTDCYTLALNYAPSNSTELRAAIYSNRSMTYVNCSKIKEAKDDARQCIELRKKWLRGYSRLAACWEAESHHQEVFNVYSRGLGAVEAEQDKLSLVADIIVLSMKLPDGAITIPVVIPAKLINVFVKQAVKDRDVEKLRHIFVEKRCQRPGLIELYCLGHNADCVHIVPLKMVLLSNVQDKEKLIEELLSRGASPNCRYGSLVTPLKLAMDDRDYRIAVMLLRHGANPQSILKTRLEPFDSQVPHFSQWINLGSRAVRNKRFARAKEFYCLALEYLEAAKDTSAKCAILRALSDVAYELESYIECLSRVKESFQVSPIKSEIEARKWQQRGNILANKGLHNIVPGYLTLAITYVAPINEKLRFELLCQRSQAFIAIKDFQQAIEDGQNATAIKPEDVQGHKCLLSCYKSLGDRRKTFSALVQSLKAEVDIEEKQQFLREALHIAVKLPDWTTTITVEVPTELIRQIHEEAIQSENWELLRLLYLGGGGPRKHDIRKGGLATNRISAEQVPIEDVVSASLAFKPETLAVFLDHGAKVEGLKGNTSPLVYSATRRDVELMKVLLDHGANPCVKADSNQMLLHREVVSSIDTGDLQILQILLDSAHPDMENFQDSDGNTLYHCAMSGKTNNNKCRVIKCLMNAKINPNIANKHRCHWSDDRYKILTRFKKEHTTKPTQEIKHQKLTKNSKDSVPSLFKEHEEELPIGETDSEQNPKSMKCNGYRDNGGNESVKSKVEIAKRKKEKEKDLLHLIETLTIKKADVSSLQKVENEDLFKDEEATVAEPEEQTVSPKCRYDEGGSSPENTRTKEMEEDETKSPFENLPWEVECTVNVWKMMRSKGVPEKTKKQIIDKIRMLAEGRRSKNLCKRIEGPPKEKGIHLYEARLTKSARIIWEKPIAFSERLNDPKLISESDQSSKYSDIIRVWDIVLDHGDLDRVIQNVCKSHHRASHPSVEKTESQTQDSNTQLSRPSYYQKRKRSSKEQHTEEKNVNFPPVNAEENTYHMPKVYSFTSAMINTLLDGDQKTNIDFPFKVTELEYAIINLKPDQPCAIILLGRSGTGKTICCLYRLWTEFQNYWENAINAGPLIPKHVPQKEEERSSISERRSSKYVSPNKEEELQEDSPAGNYEHLHQIFITKNTVLCSEVQKNFKEMKNACPLMETTIVSDDSLPNHINDIEENTWPLFIGARDWLLLLGASLPGTPFFERAPNGSLLEKIQGWGQEDTHLHFIPTDEDEDDFDEGDHSLTDSAQLQEHLKSTRIRNKKREVTYQVFVNEFWPKMKNSVKNDYHPTLVWTEIRSFIKGSAEALKTSTGFLSCDDYDQLGRKRAPNFMGDRSTIYHLFKTYQSIIRSSNGLFDEADFVYNLHRRLMENREVEWSIHNIYVDETQDFTQAELSLLIHCCRFPNRMFFTGDTAQSIMRGIAFRFEDLKTLFHGIKTSGLLTSNEPVRVPDRLHQLTHNYRSHAGILKMASSVENLLLTFFPNSLDKLDKDLGLFDGPKPVLLESCSLKDLVMIFTGNKPNESRIEFGAHQAVLVVSEEARDNMPEELKCGLVLTVYEAKGLEFNDVLIYNFFKDSHARMEWRVVLEEAHFGATGLDLKTRPLDFNPEKHKVLNSELKLLYTAITRARVNLWFFDEDEENRAPMFELFGMLDVVDTTKTLSSTFAKSSTESEWKDQGHTFYMQGLWKLAEKCFTHVQDKVMICKCKAQRYAQEALKSQANPKLMKEKFCDAAEAFLECGMAADAEVCLYNARENLLLAELYKKMQRFTEASKIFLSERFYKEASQCMEQINNYSQAIEIYCNAKLYQDAIDVLTRYKSLKVDKSMAKNLGIIPPIPNRNMERLCYKLAKMYLSQGDKDKMETVLQHLSSADRISFLKKNGCIEEAARALLEVESEESAAHFLQLYGRFQEAKKYSVDLKFLADCNLYETRSLAKSGTSGNETTIDELLKDALKYYRRVGDKNGEGEVRLLIGQRQDDISEIILSGKIFENNRNVCGEVEVIEEFLRRDVDQFYYRIIVRAIQRLLELIINLQKPYTQLKTDTQETIAICEQFFGLSRVQDQNMRRYRTKSLERFQELARPRIINHQDIATNLEEDISIKEGYDVLASHLIHKAANLVRVATQFFKCKLEFEKDQISRETSTFNCHFEVLFNWVYLDGIAATFYNELKSFLSSTLLLAIEELLLTDEIKEYYSCKLLLKFMFPDSGPSTQQLSSEQITRIRTHHAVNPRLMLFSQHLDKTLDNKDLSVDTLLQISHVAYILDMKDWVSSFLGEKERFFTETFSKTKDKKLMYEYGMLPVESSPGSFEIFFRHWERGVEKMHVHGDVEQSLHETSRCFLGYTAKSQVLVYPSIANTLMILEHQLTVALAMLTRVHCRNLDASALLPQSYLSRLEFTDEVNCPKARKNIYKTFHAIHRSAKSLQINFQEKQRFQRNIQSIISFIVRLMFGKFSKRFNVFLDTFSSRENEKVAMSGVAERVMVLSLTMLANCGKNPFLDCQEIILYNIFSVVPPVTLPHLQEAFHSLSIVRNFRDVVGVLKALLNIRNGEKLYEVRWNESRIKLNKTVAQPVNYTLKLAVNVSEMRAGIPPATECCRAVSDESTRQIKEEDLEDQDDFDSGLQLTSTHDHEKQKENEQQKTRDQAATDIQQWFRKHNQHNRQETIEDKDHSVQSIDRLSSADSSACKIVNFSETSKGRRVARK